MAGLVRLKAGVAHASVAGNEILARSVVANVRIQSALVYICAHNTLAFTKYIERSGGPKNFDRGGEDNVSAPSSFIAMRTTICMPFVREKADF